MRTLCWICYCNHFNNVSQRNSEGNGYVVCNIFHLAVCKKMCSFRVWHVLKAWQWQSSITQLEFQKQNLWRSAILSLRHLYIYQNNTVFLLYYFPYILVTQVIKTKFQLMRREEKCSTPTDTPTNSELRKGYRRNGFEKLFSTHADFLAD